VGIHEDAISAVRKADAAKEAKNVDTVLTITALESFLRHFSKEVLDAWAQRMDLSQVFEPELTKLKMVHNVDHKSYWTGIDSRNFWETGRAGRLVEDVERKTSIEWHVPFSVDGRTYRGRFSGSAQLFGAMKGLGNPGLRNHRSPGDQMQLAGHSLPAAVLTSPPTELGRHQRDRWESHWESRYALGLLGVYLMGSVQIRLAIARRPGGLVREFVSVHNRERLGRLLLDEKNLKATK
jgi:hypothetical protein